MINIENKSPTVALETHGCKLNQADTLKLIGEFEKNGVKVVGLNDQPNVYVLTSCTVTHIADRKARQSLRSAKKRNPNSIVVASGCYAERAKSDLLGVEEIDLVLGNSDKHKLVSTVLNYFSSKLIVKPGLDEVQNISTENFRTRAMVKIQEGCDQVCAYCIVPIVRGRERSLQPEIIIENIQRLVDSGFKEVVLTGTQLGTYGFDLNGINLAKLIEKILQETDVTRLRVSSIQAHEIDLDLLKLWENDRLCSHFHVPLQSGSNNILKMMRRRYTVDQYVASIQMIEEYVNSPSITTDLIVGFPGEQESHFEESKILCADLNFLKLHVFKYSDRFRTSSYYNKNKISSQVKSRRANVIRTISKDKWNLFADKSCGRIEEVLWEKPEIVDGKYFWSGHTKNYLKVYMDDRDLDLANTITNVNLDTRIEDKIFATSVLETNT